MAMTALSAPVNELKPSVAPLLEGAMPMVTTPRLVDMNIIMEITRIARAVSSAPTPFITV